MILSGNPSTTRVNEAQLLAHKQRIDAHRKAQAILRRRHAVKSAVALIAGAPRHAVIALDD